MVVGLGNPGREFTGTRHNVGADAARLVAQRHAASLRAEKGTSSEVTKVRLGGALVVVCVPQTYMNDSGLAVSALVRRFELEDLGRLVVVHDELDLPVGRVKVKSGGGTAGHNGLRSLHAHLHDDGYSRVRIGIGKPPDPRRGADHVLRAPTMNEREALSAAVEVAADAVELIATQGVDAAMARFNAGNSLA